MYFLLDNKTKNTIELTTQVYFQQPNCRQFQNRTINWFSKVSKKWESRDFEIKKFRNFNGCELVVFRFEPTEYYIKNTHNFIESHLNFSSKYVIFNYFKDNFTTEVLDHDIHLVSERMRMSVKQNRKSDDKFTMTRHVAMSDKIIIVSRFLPYTMAEKALMPLDDEVWYWLIGFMGIGVGVIVVVSFMKKTVKDFVFGLQVKVPLLNLV
jgi:hypothetical protein